MNRRICVVTGSRAEYGLLRPLIAKVSANRELDLQLVATASHLSPEFGLTRTQIDEDGFALAGTVEMLLSSDTAVGIAKSIGLGVIGFADLIDRLAPDLMVLLGDRYELLAPAQAAMVARVPVAHIGGGDYGEATHDNLTRHCLTKMSHLHFTTCPSSLRRVVQLGEDPSCVYEVGSLAVDAAKSLALLDRKALQAELGIAFDATLLVVTFHPTNLEGGNGSGQFEELSGALEGFLKEGTTVVFTMPNADNDGRHLRQQIKEFCARHENAHWFESLGMRRYLSLVHEASAVVGNSSSGIYEAPLMRTPTVDVGNRQRGRERGRSVISVETDAKAIASAIHSAITGPVDFSGYPYGDGNSASRIHEIIAGHPLDRLINKRFHDLD